MIKTCNNCSYMHRKGEEFYCSAWRGSTNKDMKKCALWIESKAAAEEVKHQDSKPTKIIFDDEEETEVLEGQIGLFD